MSSRSLDRRARSDPLRVSILAPHFAEYSCRLAEAIAADAPVQLLIGRTKLQREAKHLLAALNAANVALVETPDGGGWSKAKAVAATIAAVKSWGPTLTIAHEQTLPSAAVVAASVRLFCPLRLIVHDPYPHAGADGLHADRTRIARVVVRALATDFVVHGTHCMHELARYLRGDARPIRSIAHGVLMSPSPQQIEQPHFGRVLFFGRLEAYKGLNNLIAAADLLSAQNNQFHLHILGAGSEADRVRDLVSRKSFVTFDEGFAAPEHVVKAMQQAAVIAVPYEQATQSGVVPIAFANARPVVATRVGGIGEVVVDGVNGRLVPPQEPKAFAKALNDCLFNSQVWLRLSNGARETAERVLDWRLVAREILDL